MNKWLIGLVAVCTSVAVYAGVAFAFGTELITVGSLQIASKMVVGCSAIGILVAFAIDIGMNWCNAKKKYDNMQNSITFVKDAIDQIERDRQSLMI
jgi:hypothetical protein